MDDTCLCYRISGGDDKAYHGIILCLLGPATAGVFRNCLLDRVYPSPHNGGSVDQLYPWPPILGLSIERMRVIVKNKGGWIEMIFLCRGYAGALVKQLFAYETAFYSERVILYFSDTVSKRRAKRYR